MKQLWVLARKEVKLAFRDVGGIVTMLVTPLVLTLVISAAFGGSGAAVLSDIPVLLLNRDQGPFSEDLIAFFGGEDVKELVALELVSNEAAARARVNADEVAALVIIPEDFSEHVFPLAAEVERRSGLDLLSLSPDDDLSTAQQVAIAQIFIELQQADAEPTVVEIYASPDWRISTNVVKSIVRQSIEILNLQVQGISTVIRHLMASELTDDDTGFDASETFGMGSGFEMGADNVAALPVDVTVVSRSGRSFNWISYTAASMSVLFLMFAVTSGGRTLLAERAMGTLPRLLTSPVPAMVILSGKMAGIVLTGLLQMVILWAATGLIGAYWGPVPATLVSIVALVICASGVGALISAWSKHQGQASAIGTAVTLVGAAASGSFVPRSGLPAWVQRVSLLTPNAWGIEIFSRLQLGRRLVDILPLLGGVLVLTVVYYALALVGFRRQFD